VITAVSINSCMAIPLCLQVLLARGVLEEKIILLCIIAAPEGIHRICSRFPKVRVVTSQIDEKVDTAFCVVPGCGEFGDRWVADWLWLCCLYGVLQDIAVEYGALWLFAFCVVPGCGEFGDRLGAPLLYMLGCLHGCLHNTSAQYSAVQRGASRLFAACHNSSLVKTCNAWLGVVAPALSGARQIATTMQRCRSVRMLGAVHALLAVLISTLTNGFVMLQVLL
jgi:hypothetical protein